MSDIDAYLHECIERLLTVAAPEEVQAWLRLLYDNDTYDSGDMADINRWFEMVRRDYARRLSGRRECVLAARLTTVADELLPESGRQFCHPCQR